MLHRRDIDAGLCVGQRITVLLFAQLCLAAADEKRGDRSRRSCRIDLFGRQIEFRACRSKLHDTNAVAAQPEEIIVDPDRTDAEALLKRTAQQRFRFVFGRGIICALLRKVGIRQRLAVHLAVLVQRQRVKMRINGRNHVGGKPLSERGADHVLGLRTGIPGAQDRLSVR